jgi:hypothetical protein
MRIQSIKMGMAAVAAGGALILGGLFIGGSLVSAQTPGPSATEEADVTPPSTPGNQTPYDEGTDKAPHGNGAECDKDGDGQPDQQGSSSPSSTRTRDGSSGMRF